MKKLTLLVAGLLLFVGCSSDDEEGGIHYELVKAHVLHAELPASFEMGREYGIEVFYELPTACHIDAGVVVQRGQINSEYFIYGSAYLDVNRTGCDEAAATLEREDMVQVYVENQDTHVFHLWIGLDENEEDVFRRVEVPVDGAL